MNRTATSEAFDLAQRARQRRRLPSPDLRRAIRVDAKVSLAEVAAVVGVTRQAVGNWERGTRTPRGDDLDRYLAVLDQLREVRAA